MVQHIEVPSVSQPIIYPESDGKPMWENTEQYQWLVLIKENLEIVFAPISNVFVAGDLLWYPIEGNNKICLAPDVLVAIGRPKGKRGSYKQWEEANIAPQVVFEILSPSNTQKEMANKLLFYQRYGVEEYYIYNPEKLELTGLIRSGEWLEPIEEMNGWVSPRLAIRFEMTEAGLEIYRPDDRKFLSSVELAERIQQAEAEVEQERQRSEQAEIRMQRLEARLRELGVEIDF
jgi:Uma2 family endonuclease